MTREVKFNNKNQIPHITPPPPREDEIVKKAKSDLRNVLSHAKSELACEGVLTEALMECAENLLNVLDKNGK